jgi:TPP-dependent 2-oxoacid decarboxylase
MMGRKKVEVVEDEGVPEEQATDMTNIEIHNLDNGDFEVVADIHNCLCDHSTKANGFCIHGNNH